MTTGIDDLFTEETAWWLDALPKYQRNRLDSLLQSGRSPEEVAETWLSANVENTFPFGADSSDQLFLDKVWEEIEKFLCGSDEYATERDQLQHNTNITHTYFVGVISAAIAPTLGTSSVFLAPVIAMLLAALGKISILAWCKKRADQRSEEDSK